MSDIHKATDIIKKLAPGIALTGAGISVDSGIPPFRGSGGLWEKYDPNEYVSIGGFSRNPEKVWNLYLELGATLLEAKPNPGHIALAELEEMSYLNGVITQNIDGFHQKAGSRRVVEYHGGGDRAVCLRCHKSFPLNEDKLKEIPPKCDCGQILKPDIVFYGEQIPRAAILESQELIEESNFIIVVGTSATVVPASQIPVMVKRLGGKIIEINVEPTPLTDIADVSLFGSSSEKLPELVKILKKDKKESN
jgi:NAD-dependent deacetylase